MDDAHARKPGNADQERSQLLLELQLQYALLRPDGVADGRQGKTRRSDCDRHGGGEFPDGCFQTRETLLNAAGDVGLGLSGPAASATQSEPGIEIAPLQDRSGSDG